MEKVLGTSCPISDVLRFFRGPHELLFTGVVILTIQVENKTLWDCFTQKGLTDIGNYKGRNLSGPLAGDEITIIVGCRVPNTEPQVPVKQKRKRKTKFHKILNLILPQHETDAIARARKLTVVNFLLIKTCKVKKVYIRLIRQHQSQPSFAPEHSTKSSGFSEAKFNPGKTWTEQITHETSDEFFLFVYTPQYNFKR